MPGNEDGEQADTGAGHGAVGGHQAHPQRRGHDGHPGRRRRPPLHPLRRRRVHREACAEQGLSQLAAQGVLPHKDLPSQRWAIGKDRLFFGPSFELVDTLH